MKRSRPVSLALVGLFLWVTACTSYKQIGLGEVSDHGRVRVTFTDGKRQTLRDPWVDGDSIRASTSTLAVPVDQVAELEAVGTNEVGTIFAVLGIAVVVGAVVIVIACSPDKCSTWG